MALIAILALTSANVPKTTTVFIIGDSTAANKKIDEGKQERGWGMVLQGFFSEEIYVENHAVNGRSTKSFIDEGRWDVVLSRIKSGDYVIIQFGHNDEKPQPERHTDAGTTFDANLTKFVEETREKGGIPILMSPVVRRNFHIKAEEQADDEALRDSKFHFEEENSDTLADTHGAYRFSARNVAAETQCVYVDANKITHDIEQSFGVEGSRKLHMWFKPGEHPSMPEGRQDNTHYSVFGAHVVASALSKALAEKIPQLAKSLRDYDYIVASNGTGNYMTVEDALQDIPSGIMTKILVLEGSFKKPVVPSDKKVEFVFPEGKGFVN